MVMAARDAIVRLATTPRHRGDVDSAAEELLMRPSWRAYRRDFGRGITEARVLVRRCGSAREAEIAINGGLS